jgi:hypothetical protein
MIADTREALKEIVERYQLTGPPVLIGGCGRSGTTLLLAILGSHPFVHAIPDETHAFCPTAYGTWAGTSAGVKVESANDQLHRTRMTTFDPEAPFDLTKLDNALARWPPASAGLRWCEKTPKNILFFRRLLNELGDVRLIHVVRDGRDVVTSVHPGRDGLFHVPPERWIEEVQAGLDVADDPRTLTIRYEDLVLDYGRSIERVCGFIGEPFDERLRQWHLHTNVQQHDSWEGLAVKPINTSAIARWSQNRYSEIVDRLMADSRAIELLRRLGYEN